MQQPQGVQNMNDGGVSHISMTMSERMMRQPNMITPMDTQPPVDHRRDCNPPPCKRHKLETAQPTVQVIHPTHFANDPLSILCSFCRNHIKKVDARGLCSLDCVCKTCRPLKIRMFQEGEENRARYLHFQKIAESRAWG
ncbi:hypothetical protein NPIL_577501 [Nephila pilipes]|uniref:Uncharacterized protein n=1 Tax=Nephila pilipes TaxID=299642 RepID=A0A8X6QZF0_NEPPI|nr:hypothetical protein NPIL_577501 [Nephila pilipes]